MFGSTLTNAVIRHTFYKQVGSAGRESRTGAILHCMAFCKQAAVQLGLLGQSRAPGGGCGCVCVHTRWMAAHPARCTAALQRAV